MSPYDTSALHLVQISDTHIQADEHGLLGGHSVDQHLQQVIAHIQQQHNHAQLLLHTGDLVHDENAVAYQRLAQLLAPLERPVCCLPGNHDELLDFVHEPLYCEPLNNDRHLLVGGWQLILLDSTIKGSADGELSASELEFLDRTLQQYSQPALVALHHHLLPTGSEWLDTMVLKNAQQVFEVLDCHPQVRIVSWGHIHQEFTSERNGVTLLGCPATSVQFLPGSVGFALDQRPPGYRWFDLYPNGDFATGVEWAG